MRAVDEMYEFERLENTMKRTLSFIALVAASQAVAGEKRELDAHVHGVGTLNIAVDGDIVGMEFHAPGADIVGFEYEAKSEVDRAAIDAAVATLARPLDLFVLPAKAACTVTQASAMLEIEEDNDHDHDHEEHAEHDDHEEHADHDDHDHAEHEDEEHAEHDDHDHAEHDHDEHDHAEAAGQHTEFHAEYTLNCASPEALDSIEFAYFDTFENALELEVQIIAESGAQAFEVTREDANLDLQNLF